MLDHSLELAIAMCGILGGVINAYADSIPTIQTTVAVTLSEQALVTASMIGTATVVTTVAVTMFDEKFV